MEGSSAHQERVQTGGASSRSGEDVDSNAESITVELNGLERAMISTESSTSQSIHPLRELLPHPLLSPALPSATDPTTLSQGPGLAATHNSSSSFSTSSILHPLLTSGFPPLYETSGTSATSSAAASDPSRNAAPPAESYTSPALPDQNPHHHHHHHHHHRIEPQVGPTYPALTSMLAGMLSGMPSPGIADMGAEASNGQAGLGPEPRNPFMPPFGFGMLPGMPAPMLHDSPEILPTAQPNLLNPPNPPSTTNRGGSRWLDPRNFYRLAHITNAMREQSRPRADPSRAKELLRGLADPGTTALGRLIRLCTIEDMQPDATGQGPKCGICLETITDILTAREEEKAQLEQEGGLDTEDVQMTLVEAALDGKKPDLEQCDTSLRVFPCNHIFCKDCISPWLASHTTCPTCRFDLDPNSITLRRPVSRQRRDTRLRPRPEGGDDTAAAAPYPPRRRPLLPHSIPRLSVAAPETLPPLPVSQTNPLGGALPDQNPAAALQQLFANMNAPASGPPPGQSHTEQTIDLNQQNQTGNDAAQQRDASPDQSEGTTPSVSENGAPEQHAQEHFTIVLMNSPNPFSAPNLTPPANPQEAADPTTTQNTSTPIANPPGANTAMQSLDNGNLIITYGFGAPPPELLTGGQSMLYRFGQNAATPGSETGPAQPAVPNVNGPVPSGQPGQPQTQDGAAPEGGPELALPSRMLPPIMFFTRNPGMGMGMMQPEEVDYVRGKTVWTAPAAKQTLEEWIRSREKALGIVCDDPHCNHLGPTENEQLEDMSFKIKTFGQHDDVCEHTYHFSCLRESNGITGWYHALDPAGKRAVLRCPTCRAYGWIDVPEKEWNALGEQSSVVASA